MTLPFMSIGALGVISVLSNIAPEDVHDMCEKFAEGKVKEAMDMQLKAVPITDALFSEVNPIPIKKAMSYMGMCEDVYRAPLCTMDETKAEALKEEMKAYGLL